MSQRVSSPTLLISTTYVSYCGNNTVKRVPYGRFGAAAMAASLKAPLVLDFLALRISDATVLLQSKRCPSFPAFRLIEEIHHFASAAAAVMSPMPMSSPIRPVGDGDRDIKGLNRIAAVLETRDRAPNCRTRGRCGNWGTVHKTSPPECTNCLGRCRGQPGNRGRLVITAKTPRCHPKRRTPTLG